MREEINYTISEVELPQIVSIKQASEIMSLPPHYIRRLCLNVPGLAFQSGTKWYVNLNKLSSYFNGELGHTVI